MKIRWNVFETNSSSVHTLSIVKDANLKVVPEKVIFGSGEFGWGPCSYTATFEKAAYIWECIKTIYNEDQEKLSEVIEKIKKTLSTYNIECDFPYANVQVKSWTGTDGKTYSYNEYVDDAGIKDSGYVDHAWSAKTFIEDIINDETKLINFLFDSRSFIVTGNDNDEYYEECPYTGGAEAWEYEKGN